MVVQLIANRPTNSYAHFKDFAEYKALAGVD